MALEDQRRVLLYAKQDFGFKRGMLQFSTVVLHERETLEWQCAFFLRTKKCQEEKFSFEMFTEGLQAREC